MTDPFNLRRFVDAQASQYAFIREELQRGRKQGHWMWFVFPQIQGLGHSSMARKFAVSGLPEAEAYLDHAVLGPRLRECTGLVIQVDGRSVFEIFGDPDYLKFRSCMTLFSRAKSDDRIFQDALDKFFGGEPDRVTLEALAAAST